MQLLTYFQGITLDLNVSCDKSKRISTQMQAGDFLKIYTTRVTRFNFFLTFKTPIYQSVYSVCVSIVIKIFSMNKMFDFTTLDFTTEYNPGEENQTSHNNEF